MGSYNKNIITYYLIQRFYNELRRGSYMTEGYKVKLDAFEGPLDLLLHLINQYEIDIHDIPVSQITEQYMHYIHTMQHLELNIASEYLVMASTLVAIKSEMLLPKPDLSDEDLDDYMEDPREELKERLIEYKKYKDAASGLKEKERDANQIFTRTPIMFEEYLKKPPIVQGDISIYDMIGALGKVFQRKKWNAPLETRVQRVEIPIEDRMEEILVKVKSSSQGVPFEDLFTYKTKSHVVVTFMAVLELMKHNQVLCKQKSNFDSLLIHSAFDEKK